MPRKEEYWADPEKSRAYAHKLYALHPEKEKEQQNRFYEKHPKKREEYKSRYKDRYKGRYKEYQREYYLKKIERLRKINRINKFAQRYVLLGLKCEKCGSTENLGRHHPDYSKPLEIQTLCSSCHRKEHYINPPSF